MVVKEINVQYVYLYIVLTWCQNIIILVIEEVSCQVIHVTLKVDDTGSGMILRLPPFARTDEFIEAGNNKCSLHIEDSFSLQ